MTTVVSDHAAKVALDEGMSNKERVLIALETLAKKNGSVEIYQSTEDVAAVANLKPQSAYQAIYALMKHGDVNIILDNFGPSDNRKKIIGFRLNRAPDPVEVIANGAERAKKESKTLARKVEKPLSFPVLGQYIGQKEAVSKAIQILTDAGLTSTSIAFEENPLAEEAIAILNELMETRKQLGDAKIDLEAARRSTQFNHEN